MQSRVAVLDAGGQYVDLVKKAVERQGLPADVLPLDTEPNSLTKKYGAVIISGSPASSHAETAPQPHPDLWEIDLPILGICYGMQSMVVAGGGKVIKNAIREDGRITTTVDTSHPLFDGLKQEFVGLFTHGDFVKTIPKGFKTIGSHKLSDGTTAFSAIAKDDKIGVQFHPEVFDDTPEGYELFKNFLFDIADLDPDEKFMETRLNQIVSEKQRLIKDKAGSRHVIAFVSGGVDSSVTVVLASQSIKPEKLDAFYIDNGFMRDEDDSVIEALKAAGINVQKINAIKEFEDAVVQIDGQTSLPLSQTSDPETKRKIIGKEFVAVQNRLVEKLNLSEAMLLQGTNAADRIESGHSTGDSHTQTIKTHHNQVHEVQELKDAGLLIEPIDDLFKDEVRELGRHLGLPDELVDRQPFPGPGLAIRIIAEDTSDPELLPPEEEQKVQKFIDKIGIKSQAYVLPIRSVGVGGDERSHLNVAAVDNAKLTAKDLEKLGTELPAHFRDNINRVIYALGPQPLADRSLTRTLLTSDVRAQLRHADRIVFEEMRSAGLLGEIKQFPVILLPLSFGVLGQRSIVLRPVTTSTFMTVQAMLPGRDLPVRLFERITGRILTEVEGITQVFLDLTNKPPATTEWE